MNNAKIRKKIIRLEDLDDINKRLPNEKAKDVKRQLRKPLLNALDVYDKNVSKGRIIESYEQKKEVDSWYQDVCDLQDEGFKNIPDCINKYKGA